MIVKREKLLACIEKKGQTYHTIALRHGNAKRMQKKEHPTEN